MSTRDLWIPELPYFCIWEDKVSHSASARELKLLLQDWQFPFQARVVVDPGDIRYVEPEDRFARIGVVDIELPAYIVEVDVSFSGPLTRAMHRGGAAMVLGSDSEARIVEMMRVIGFEIRSETIDGRGTRERIPDDVQIFVWRRDSGKCVKCGSTQNLEFDHIIPLSKGGSNTARNIQLLCESCNRSKGASIGG